MKKLWILILVIFAVNLAAQVGLDERYHTYAEIIQKLDSLQTNFPDYCHVEIIGSTLGANPYQAEIPIYALKISDNPAIDEDEPAVMYAGQCHAEEVLGVEITMFMIEDIIENRFVDPYNVWIDNLEMWFIPTYNPEGLQVVMDGWDVTYRKNKRDNNLNGIFDYETGSGGDIDGVDLNRNYGFNWIHGDTLYAGGAEEWNDYYRGPSPFSEGGTQTIRDFAEQQHIIYSINWHSSRTGNFSEKVYYSFKWDGIKESPDFDLAQSIGQNVADLIIKEDGSGPYECYPSNGRKGNAHDWFYKTYGTFQLLIECGTQNIQPPPAIVDDTCERCSIGAYWLLDRALGYNADAAMLTGNVTDADTGEPLAAEVIIPQYHASFFEPRISDQEYGRYWRPLMPGTYSMKIVKKGYEIKNISGVTVNNSLWKVQNVQLDPLPEADVFGSVTANGTPVDGTLLVLNSEYIATDTLSFTDGSFNFQNYAGENTLIIIVDGEVPHQQTVNLTEGTNTIPEIQLVDAITVFAEDWEETPSDWEFSGGWTLTDNSYNGNFAITDSPDEFYENGITAIAQTSVPINLNGVSNDAVLTFWHKYQTEHDHDFCSVEYSFNNNDWNELISFSGKMKPWQKEFIFIPELVDHHVYLRFKLVTDDSIDDPGWWIDKIKIISSSGSEAGQIIVPKIKLYQNYPNPFNPTTTISFSLTTESTENTEIIIYNLKGQKIRTLECIDCVDAASSQMRHSIVWNGRDENNKPVSSGVYFYQLQIDKETIDSKKMLLIK